MLRLCCSLIVGTLAVAAAGCGGSDFGDPVPVTGKILLKGQPVVGAQVTFHSKEKKGRSAGGRTGADGTFSLTTFKTDDGALPGDYIVTVSKIEGGASDSIDVAEGEYGDDYGAMMDGAATGSSEKMQKDNKLPAKYADVLESGIARSVSDSPPNDFEISLD